MSRRAGSRPRVTTPCGCSCTPTDRRHRQGHLPALTDRFAGVRRALAIARPQGHTRPMAGTDVPPPHRTEPESASPPRGLGLMDVRDPLPPELRDPTFSSAVRGYDRHEVDRYVERVNGLIAELQISGSPRAAVRHALDRVGEQTSGILQRARETAEEIIASAREEAEETTQRAKAEARDILADAQRRADEVTSGAGVEAREIVATANARAEDTISKAGEEAERTVSSARAEADAEMQRTNEEIAALRAEAEAQLRALESDIAEVSEARRRALDDAKELVATLS